MDLRVEYPSCSNIHITTYMALVAHTYIEADMDTHTGRHRHPHIHTHAPIRIPTLMTSTPWKPNQFGRISAIGFG